MIRASLDANEHSAGKPAHIVRESAYFAYGLLLTGDAADAKRAARALEGVLAKQNRDEASPFWACFTYEAEQDWATWKKPDQNWAQFVGCALGHVLELEEKFPSLPAELCARVKEAFVLCVRATLKRDVGASYTNIALLSSAVAAAGARVAAVPGAAEFARRKLGEVAALLPEGACFDEYLSPTYYGVNLLALAAAKRFATDAETRGLAEKLSAQAWSDLVRFYHPATHQIGGPQSRAYGDEILGYVALVKYFLFLALEGDFPLSVAETEHTHDLGTLFLIAAQDVPPVPALRSPPMGALTVKQPDAGKRIGPTLTSWKEEKFILGSVSAQDEWEQRRNLVAYWPDRAGVHPVVVRSSFEGPAGMDRKKVRFYSAQRERAVLVCVHALPGASPSGEIWADLISTAGFSPSLETSDRELRWWTTGWTMRWVTANTDRRLWASEYGPYWYTGSLKVSEELVKGEMLAAYLVEFLPGELPKTTTGNGLDSEIKARLEGRTLHLSAHAAAGPIELKVELPAVVRG